MLEIKNVLVVVVLVFIKCDGLCGITEKSTLHEFLCTRNAVCVHVKCMVITIYVICEDLSCQRYFFYSWKLIY